MKRVFLFSSLILALLLSACSVPGVASLLTPVSSNTSQGSQPVVNQSPAYAQQPQGQVVQPGPVQRSISVSGSGQVTMAPELAFVYIGVHSQEEDVAASLQDNNAKTQAVSSALKDMGIEEKDIQTSSFNIYPQQQYTPMGEMGPMVYVVDNTVYVTVRNLQTLGQVLDVAVRSGANSINGISFDVSDQAKAQAITDARKMAVDSARLQAQALADAAGVQLGEILTINAYTSDQPIPMMDTKAEFAQGASQVPISAGQIVIRVEVSASFGIQ